MVAVKKMGLMIQLQELNAVESRDDLHVSLKRNEADEFARIGMLVAHSCYVDGDDEDVVVVVVVAADEHACVVVAVAVVGRNGFYNGYCC